jgi:hypothetical protein
MNKKIPNSLSMRRKPTSVKSVEKEYGVNLKASRSNMNLSTYMEKSGLPEMARLLRTVEKDIQSENQSK